MNRYEFEFRAWDIILQKYQYLIQNTYFETELDEIQDRPSTYFSMYLNRSRYIVEQYTNKLDRNKFKIYVGDIISYTSAPMNDTTIIVVKSIEDFAIKSHITEMENILIIGNIHTHIFYNNTLQKR